MDKSKIPYGDYCYEIIDRNDDGILKIKTCPYRKFLEMKNEKGTYNGEPYDETFPVYICEYTGITSDEDVCFWDRVKVCGENEPDWTVVYCNNCEDEYLIDINITKVCPFCKSDRINEI